MLSSLHRYRRSGHKLVTCTLEDSCSHLPFTQIRSVLNLLLQHTVVNVRSCVQSIATVKLVRLKTRKVDLLLIQSDTERRVDR